jgi:1,4-alpha-glucan branching enzyme
MKMISQVCPRFTEEDVYLFRAGKHMNLWQKMGAHLMEHEGVKGAYFAVWAPSADKVEVIGSFNQWNGHAYELFVRWDSSGIWEGFIPHVREGDLYKFKIYNQNVQGIFEKADPFARQCEHPPKTASVVAAPLKDRTGDSFAERRKKINAFDQAMSVYEVHLASWKRTLDDNRPLYYSELMEELVPYVKEMGFTHVELMPVMEYPFDPSWGYQITGYFAPTSRFGDADGFRQLVEAFHEEGIGVILDWVPAHFPSDAHGLGLFDGSHLYEHPDRRKGYHPDWKSLIFNYERPEVRSFLLSNAYFWLDQYKVDGLRVDAVASMLYLDYSRNDGEWEPNAFGGRENLAAIDFIKDLNTHLYQHHPDIQMIAEESTSFSGVTRPVHEGGLGFGLKWMMGWMNDTLEYFKNDPIYRKYHHGEITFSLTYAFSEQFTLPFSHDEVVHGKGSLLERMPGDDWQQFANLRLLYAYMYAHPGSKLLFMGQEFAQRKEWNHQYSLDWHLLESDPHNKTKGLVAELNRLYRTHKGLHEMNYSSKGFAWLDYGNADQSVISFWRTSKTERILIYLNFTPNVYPTFYTPEGQFECIFNSDHREWGGSNAGPKLGELVTQEITLPPLGAVFLQCIQ